MMKLIYELMLYAALLVTLGLFAVVLVLTAYCAMNDESLDENPTFEEMHG